MPDSSRFAARQGDPVVVTRLETRPETEARGPSEAALTLVSDALARLRFGDIRLTVHEGRLVQVDVTERTRFG